MDSGLGSGFLLKYLCLFPVFKFSSCGKKSTLASHKLCILQLFGIRQEYMICRSIHTIISSLRVGGDALEEQSCQVKDYGNTKLEDFSFL